ncbi:hypothetical protein [Thiolapillus sp.]|uniref:hypothetical protein n=3 Tax=Thiolapillus sp. TaxID=2017437 RepID=UPI0025FCBC63|nr:hypothetical protein [Thiolapillus sp.]
MARNKINDEPRAIKKAWRLFSPNLGKRWKESVGDGGFRKGVFAGYRNLMSYLRLRRAAPGVFPDNFDALMREWGIEKDELAIVIRNMTFEIAIYVIIIFFMVSGAFYFVDKNLFMSMLLLLLAVVMFAAVFMRWWRVSVLRNRVPISFWRWLRS